MKAGFPAADGAWSIRWIAGGLQVEVRGTKSVITEVSLRKAFSPAGFFVLSESDSLPALGEKLRTALVRYFAGEADSGLERLPVDLSKLREFQKKVLCELHLVRFGSLITYGELASRIGGRRFARAVAGALAANPFPLIYPCHRVVPAGFDQDHLGGYSSLVPGEGEEIKRMLLKLENPEGIFRVSSTNRPG